MKRIQQTYGPNKVQVLLLSVDLDYGTPTEQATEGDAKVLKKHGVESWTNVLLPHGWDDTQRRFNLDGYGITIVGPDGIVRGVDVRGDEMEKILAKIVK